jgi:large subunit ribosomal protein L5
MTKFGYKSVMQIPKLDKIVINVGCRRGQGQQRRSSRLSINGDLAHHHRPEAHRCHQVAKKSVANFKLREGMPIGVKVTLRGEKMWEFLDRLFNVALPRVRDFRGINPNAFDGRGNYSSGHQGTAHLP